MKTVTLLLLFYSFTIFAQTAILKGKVTDTRGKGIHGANIIISELSIGSASDENGNFEIKKIPLGIYTVKVSSIGYKTIEYSNISISDSIIRLNFVLTSDIFRTDDVVITASKYEQQLLNLPYSASVIHESDIKKKTFMNFDDVLRYAPGVNITLDQVSIRGSSGYTRGAGTRVLVAFDGIPLYTGDTGEIIWEMIPINQIDKVEVIKGASSSIYGSTAIGGVINVLSKPIKENQQIFLSSQIGFYDSPSHTEWKWSDRTRILNKQVIGYQYGWEKTGINFSLARFENDSYRENDFFKRYAGFFKIKHEFSSVTSLSFFVSHLTQHRGNFIYWKNIDKALNSRDEDLNQSVNSKRTFFAGDLKFISGKESYFDFKTSYYLTDWKDESSSANNSTSHLIRNEISFISSLDNNSILTSGIELINGKVKSNIFSNPTSLGIGVYSQFETPLSSFVTLTSGVRYDLFKNDTLKSNSAFSPKIGIIYKANHDLSFRSSIGAGFRSPSLAETFTQTSLTGIQIKSNPLIEPEKNISTEIGMKYLLFENSLIDAALFYNRYDKFIEPDVDPADGKIFFTNLDKAFIAGVELNYSTPIISDAITCQLNYTLITSKNERTKKELKYRPKNMLYTNINFNFIPINFGVDFRTWSRMKEIDDKLIQLGIVRDGEQRVAVYVLDFYTNYFFTYGGIPFSVSVKVNNLLNYNYVEMIGNLSPIRNFILSIDTTF